VERRIEALLACGDLGGLSLTFRPAENMRLRSLTKTCLGEFLDCLVRFSFCPVCALPTLHIRGHTGPPQDVQLQKTLVQSLV
jgi:hypothetical protein